MADYDKSKQEITVTPAQQATIPVERASFKNLVLGNPNYFGTFPKFGGKVTKKLSGDTTFEQLTCVGLKPSGFQGAGLLEAVVNIKQNFGYGTDGCGAGTTEYVRFFVKDASGWRDLGATSVQVYELAGPKPLSYSVAVDFSELRKFCGTENIVEVRAILSWQWEPTAGDPNFIPVWGNIVNAKVQVAPLFILDVSISELIAENKISIDPGLLKNIDAQQPLPANPPKPLSFSELKTLYASEKVPGHRLGFSDAIKLSTGSIAKSLISIAPTIPQNVAAKFTDIVATTESLLAGEELGAILAGIAQTSGDTTFEQLTCAGYNPQTRALQGIIQIKQGSGYSGGLCTVGSTEYVGFYAFFGGVWHPLGVAQVQVHDLKAANQTDPVSYAVFRVSNLTSMPCEELEGIPLRAILSWQTPPTGANFVPVWGNVVNTHVQPQTSAADGEQVRLMRVGQVTISNINGSGLAVVGSGDPGFVAGDCAGDDSPFGGETIAEGDFIPKIDVFDHTTGAVLPGTKPIIYQAWVTPSGGSPFQLGNSFGIELFPPAAINPVFMLQTVTPAPGPVPGGVPGTLYYTYMESDLQAVNPRTLAVFEAGGLAEGNYTIEIRGFKWDGVANYLAIPVQSKTIEVYNGYPHFELTAGGILVQEFRPQVAITLTSPSGDCGDVEVGDTITGSYSVTDNFFSVLTVGLLPITVGGIPQPENSVVLSNANSGQSAVVYDGTNTTGAGGTFTLSTAGMTPCGYTILLQAWDRALVNDSCSGHYNDMGVGFCLRPKSPPIPK